MPSLMPRVMHVVQAPACTACTLPYACLGVPEVLTHGALRAVPAATCSHRDTYIIQPEDQVLIPEKCTNFPTCQAEYG